MVVDFAKRIHRRSRKYPIGKEAEQLGDLGGLKLADSRSKVHKLRKGGEG